MPVTWNAEAVPESVRTTVIDGKPQLSVTTEALVYLTMGVGIREITASNAGEFYARVRLYETLIGVTMTNGSGEPVMITATDVRNHIGLTTNAPLLTAAKFRKILLDRAFGALTFEYDQSA